jgi:O-antigen ligase
MNTARPTYLSRALFGFYWLFVVSSAFSIAVSQIALGVAVVLFVVQLIRTKPNLTISPLRHIWLLMVLYVGWMVIASILNDNAATSLVEIREGWLFLAVPAGVLVMQNQRDRRCILNAFIVALIVAALYGVLQYFTGLSLFKTHAAAEMPFGGFRAQGGFSHALTYGNYISVAAVTLLTLALHRQSDLPLLWSTLAVVVGLLAVIATVLSFSRGPIIGLILSLVIIAALLRSRKALAALAVGGLVCAVLIWQVPYMADRFTTGAIVERDGNYQRSRRYIWSHTIEIIRQHPVIGVGPANFRDHYRATIPEESVPEFVVPHAHNDLLQVTVEGGLPAAVLWLGLWLAILTVAWRGRRHRSPDRLPAPAYSLAMLLGSLMFLMTSVTEASFFDEEVRQLAMFVWAIGLADWYHYRRQLPAA